ncbi:NAD(P)-binding protein [Testicularia cyperi]|uniref:NAD(P)-binding protein n=1 Tax=Testicularia cyperi TaxID=1882483 RepID=A0A317XXC0_9BASI|nr:NAD(P)-binding protein [Testicularia cyperi]
MLTAPPVAESPDHGEKDPARGFPYCILYPNTSGFRIRTTRSKRNDDTTLHNLLVPDTRFSIVNVAYRRQISAIMSSSSTTAEAACEPTPNVPSLNLFDLKGKVCLLTGGTRGIGQACAVALVQAGASVILAVRPGTAGSESHPALKPLLDATPSNGSESQKHSTVDADLSDMEQVKTVFDRALTQSPTGSIDILVNCGGIQRRHPSTDFPESDWDEVLNVNLKSVWLLSQAAGRHMVARRSGKIINFGSLLTFQGGLTVPAYASAKGAVGQLTKALSNEWAKHNIQVNGIAPGYIATDMNEKLLADPTRLRQISERIPAGRWGNPNDFAGPLLFLASNASQYVSGEMLVVDGGWMGR